MVKPYPVIIEAWLRTWSTDFVREKTFPGGYRCDWWAVDLKRHTHIIEYKNTRKDFARDLKWGAYILLADHVWFVSPANQFLEIGLWQIGLAVIDNGQLQVTRRPSPHFVPVPGSGNA